MNKSKKFISLLTFSTRTLRQLPAMGEPSKTDNSLMNSTDKWFNR